MHLKSLFSIATLLLVLLAGRPAFSQVSRERQLVDSLVRVADSMQRVAQPVVVTDSMLQQVAGDTTRDSARIAMDTARRQPVATAPASGSPYTITGTVKDKNTGEGIPFATVFFPGTQIGTPADLDGRFTLTFDTPPGDSLKVQAMGYGNWARRFDKRKHESTVIVELTREATALKEFVVKYEDRALALVKKIIERKPYNNPDRFRNYKYEVYNKLEVDLQRLSKAQFEKLPVPMIKKFSFIYDNLDTTSEETPYLPFFLTETLSDYYFRHEPKKTREFIKASQVKGIKNESIDKFLGAMYQNINAYNNFLPVFDKQFVSPISNAGPFYYKYRIIDTQAAYGHQIVLVQFTPRRNGENAFFGDFWVVDSIYALQRISMEVPKDANINWVTRVSLYQEFAPVHDSAWFSVKDKFMADFVAPYSMKLPGFVGRKTTSYKDIVVNSDSVDAVLDNSAFKTDIILSDSARTLKEDFWSNARHDTLNKNEKAIYHMMDTLESMPVFTRFKNTMKFLVTGLVDLGPVELGPYYYLYSSNPVEGSRFRLGLNTTRKLFKDVLLSGYGAYGLKDERFKYFGSALWLLDRSPRTYLFASFRHDVERNNNNNYDYQVGANNLFGTIGRKSSIPFKMAFVDDARLEFYKQYHSGFSHMLTMMHRRFEPYAPLPSIGIFKDKEGHDINKVISTEAGVQLRFAYKEEYLEGDYYRVSLGSKWPLVEARYGVGLKNVLQSNYDYHRFYFSIADDMKISPFGNFYYRLFAGKIVGTLPYPLLEAHPGNEFYYYNRNAFNMMNRFEFISDQYAGFNFEHTIGGGIFNYIPYLKKAKLRQFWTAKGVIGSLTDANKALNFNKEYTFRTLEGNPYIELGTGVANIFQIFRIDFVWRVTPRPLPQESQNKYFGIFGSVRFNF